MKRDGADNVTARRRIEQSPLTDVADVPRGTNGHIEDEDVPWCGCVYHAEDGIPCTHDLVLAKAVETRCCDGNNPACPTRGIAASNERQNAFYRAHEDEPWIDEGEIGFPQACKNGCNSDDAMECGLNRGAIEKCVCACHRLIDQNV